MSAKPSPVTSPTATEVAPVVVRVVVTVSKVTVAGATMGVVVAAEPPVTRWTSRRAGLGDDDVEAPVAVEVGQGDRDGGAGPRPCGGGR